MVGAWSESWGVFGNARGIRVELPCARAHGRRGHIGPDASAGAMRPSWREVKVLLSGHLGGLKQLLIPAIEVLLPFPLVPPLVGN